jgi:hypothetical protein
LKTVEENKDHEKRGYWKDRWRTWRDEKYGLNNGGTFFNSSGAVPNSRRNPIDSASNSTD